MESVERKNGGYEARIKEFRERCIRAGLKITPQRLAVYRTLVGTKLHPTADMVYKMVKPVMPNISFDTVNRTLKTIRGIGAAFTVEGSGQQKRYDADMSDHRHFRCLKCGTIIDIFTPSEVDVEIPEEIKKDCEVVRKTLYYEGLCNDCNSGNKHYF